MTLVTSEDIAKLNSFSRYVSHKDQLNDNAGDIIEKTKLQLENLREYIRNISKQPHYDAASKDFKTSKSAPSMSKSKKSICLSLYFESSNTFVSV